MTLIPATVPVINPVQLTGLPDGNYTLPDVQPWTYRAGITAQGLLESMRDYLENTLVPYLKINFPELQNSWTTEVTSIIDSVNTALSTQSDTINQALTTQQQEVSTDLQNKLNEIAAGENAALNDATMKSALQTANSQTLAFLNTLYAPASVSSRFDATVLNTWEHGIVADGTTDDSAALTTLLSGITTPTRVRFPVGKTVNLAAVNYAIDVSLVTFEGDNTTLTGTGTISLFSSQAYATNQKAWRVALSGIILSGVSLTIGHATNTQNGKFRIRDGGMLGGTLTFITNAWKIVFEHFHLQGTAVVSNAPTNTGECMVFRDCMWGDGTTVNIAGGDWQFAGCSFDNMGLSFTADAVVTFDAPHFENNGGNSRRVLSLAGSGTSVHINGGILVIDAGTGDWTEAPFYVDPAVVNGGLSIDGMQVPLQSYFKPEITDNIRVLVAGGGSATFSNIKTFDSAATGYALGEAANLIHDPDAEATTLAGWTGSGTGSYNRDTTLKNRGSASHQMVAPSGQSYSFYQDVPVTPGKKLWVSMWQSFNPATGGTVNSQIDFYNRAGQVMNTVGFDQLTAATTRQKSVVARVPVGAASARITFYLSGTTAGTATCNIDDVIANVA